MQLGLAIGDPVDFACGYGELREHDAAVAAAGVAPGDHLGECLTLEFGSTAGEDEHRPRTVELALDVRPCLPAIGEHLFGVEVKHVGRDATGEAACRL